MPHKAKGDMNQGDGAMKKVFAFLRVFALSAMFVAAAANAQEAEDDNAAAEGIRPQMPRLFFTNEQRRILEVVRQEFITEENLEFAEFAPLLIEQQETIEEEEIGRNYDLQMAAFVRNRSSGDGVLWINNEQYSLNDVSGVLGREGLDGLSLGADGVISGADSINNSRFVVRIGQTLKGDGAVHEAYPVIIVKKQ